MRPHAEIARRTALRFVLLIGVVSMFSDMAHEGARSISGPFLGSLGASATVVAVVAGFGEFLGYALRFVFGYLADRTGRYWPITLFGYTLQMVVVPLLALAGGWPVAALLIVVERTGRAIRNPARDAMLAHATGQLGRGWVFGVREALDAGGAMIGPLLVAAAIYVHGGYRVGFAVLLIPALLTLVVLLGAWRQYPTPGDLEVREGVPDRRGIPAVFWLYLAAMGLIALAYADYPLIAYHLSKAHVVSTGWIPILYAGAMASEAAAALVLGRLFDRIGLLTVVGGDRADRMLCAVGCSSAAKRSSPWPSCSGAGDGGAGVDCQGRFAKLAAKLRAWHRRWRGERHGPGFAARWRTCAGSTRSGASGAGWRDRGVEDPRLRRGGRRR
jgi:MFS family permease